MSTIIGRENLEVQHPRIKASNSTCDTSIKVTLIAVAILISITTMAAAALLAHYHGVGTIGMTGLSIFYGGLMLSAIALAVTLCARKKAPEKVIEKKQEPKKVEPKVVPAPTPDRNKNEKGREFSQEEETLLNGSDVESIALRLDNDPTLIGRVDSHGHTVIHLACMGKHASYHKLDVVCKKAPQHINAIDQQKMTPLHHAARSYDLAKYLLLKGALPSLGMVDCNGRIPLHYAVDSQKYKTIELMAKGDVGSVLITDNQGYSVLHLTAAATHHEDQKKIFEYLLNLVSPEERTNQLENKTKDRNNILHLAVTSNRDVGFIQWLVKQDAANTYEQNDKGETPFHLAARISNIEYRDPILKILEESISMTNKDEVLNKKDKDGKTYKEYL